MVDNKLIIAEHERRKETVIAFYTRCKELGIGFGDEVVMAAKIDALVDTLFGPHVIDAETGDLIEGSLERVRYEIRVAERLLELATDAGLRDPADDLILPQHLNRQQRRSMQRRR